MRVGQRLRRHKQFDTLNFNGKFEPQLVTLFCWQPICHLRKDDFVIFECALVPRTHILRLFRCFKNFHQFTAHLFPIRLIGLSRSNVAQIKTELTLTSVQLIG